MNKQFTDESIGKKKNQVATKIEPKMLPTRFRERTALTQRIYLLSLVVIYSVAVGVMTFTLMGGLASKMLGVYKGNSMILMLTTIVSMITLFTGIFSPMWSKNRKLLYTWVEFTIMLMAPLIYIAGFLYVDLAFNYSPTDPKKLLLVVGIITLVSNAVPIMATIIKTSISVKRFKNSLIKALLVAPGNLIIALTNLIVWIVIKTNLKGELQFNSIVIIAASSVFIGGILFLIFGVVMSLKWDIKGSKSIWTSVRVVGALPVLIIYTTLFVIGVKFMEGEFNTPVIITLSMDILWLAGLITFVIFKGGIKNLIETNPIFNNVVLRMFVILVAVTGLINVSLMDQMEKLRDFGPSSFFILVLTSIFVLIGVVVAHFGKIITYTRFLNAMIAAVAITLLLILVIIISIIVLQRSEVILAIISRQIVSVFLIFSVVTEMLSLSLEVTNTIIRIVRDSKEQRKQEENKSSQRTVKGAK